MVGEVILYTTEDGRAKVQLRHEAGTVWLTQLEMAELFQTTKQNVSLHIKNILDDGELWEEGTVKDYLTVQNEGGREVQRPIKVYNLDMILAVGYRVRSPRGVQFRRWANTILKEYLIKGFAMDDDRLKGLDQWDYYEEWLARIRDIRASEKRFYQKMRDLFATAIDYDKNSVDAQMFYKVVQNKMLWAVTGNTAAELIVDRSNPELPNMGLTNWEGRRVHKADVSIAKNYLQPAELEELNRIVTMYLDHAEHRALKRQAMTMRDWAQVLDAFLKFNGHEILEAPGRVRAAIAGKLAEERYEQFDSKRREAERVAADKEDLYLLEQMQQTMEAQRAKL